jgi:hypothetical protein
MNEDGSGDSLVNAKAALREENENRGLSIEQQLAVHHSELQLAVDIFAV